MNRMRLVALAEEVAAAITDGPSQEWSANRDRFDMELGEAVMRIAMGSPSAMDLARAFKDASDRHLLSVAERAEVNVRTARALSEQGYSVKVSRRADLRLVTEDEFEQMATGGDAA